VVPASLPHFSTDQVAAFVELSRHGQIRAAAGTLGLSEQGLRNRLLALEGTLGVQLYRKSRGPRRMTPLTDAGRRFLPHALAFLERAHELCQTFSVETAEQEVRVAGSQYLIRYLFIDILKHFRRWAPGIHVRVSTMTELEVEETLRQDLEVAFGLAAPYEPSPDLEYHELFAMSWSLIVPPQHALARRRVRLADVAREPLILYERGSTGRQHVLDAFHAHDLSPRVRLEATSTETIVSMVEANLGVSIVPLLPGGSVTRGRRVAVCPLRESIRPIHSGVLLRRGEILSSGATQLLEFTKSRFQSRIAGIRKRSSLRRAKFR
jgi:DNA-binding transcriptional LysR family regulator